MSDGATLVICFESGTFGISRSIGLSRTAVRIRTKDNLRVFTTCLLNDRRFPLASTGTLADLAEDTSVGKHDGLGPLVPARQRLRT